MRQRERERERARERERENSDLPRQDVCQKVHLDLGVEVLREQVPGEQDLKQEVLALSRTQGIRHCKLDTYLGGHVTNTSLEYSALLGETRLMTLPSS